MRVTVMATASLLVLLACPVMGIVSASAEPAVSAGRDPGEWRLPATTPRGGTTAAQAMLADTLLPLGLTAICATVLALVTGRRGAPARSRRPPRR